MTVTNQFEFNKKRLIIINLILKLEKSIYSNYTNSIYNLDSTNIDNYLIRINKIDKIINKYSICEIEYKKC
jgi:hypothetical protein